MWLTGRLRPDFKTITNFRKGEEILAVTQAGITAIVPKPLTSSSTAEGRLGVQGFISWTIGLNPRLRHTSVWAY